MSVVGVDFGTLNTVIAVARNRGVDVITNEVCLVTRPCHEEAMLTSKFVSRSLIELHRSYHKSSTTTGSANNPQITRRFRT